MPTSRGYPRRTLEQALRVPVALKVNGGNPWRSGDVAEALGLGASSGNFWYITAAARDYGLTTGTRDSTEISLTPLGRRAVYPSSPEDEADALRQAFFAVELFQRVVTHFGGSALPEQRFLTNILRETFGLPEDQHEEFVDIFMKNCRFLSIGTDFSPSARRARDSAADERSEVVTVGGHTEDDAPVCFVIMPFKERDDNRAAGFFDEVLEQVLTPAAEKAGFKVTTARRHGSDLIQSTIVNDLLEADLVLADLTEHNPNVLFELGLRIMIEKPVALVKARGTGPIFDVDYMLRVIEYSPNLWPSTVATDIPRLEEHLRGAWDNRSTTRSFIEILRRAD